MLLIWLPVFLPDLQVPLKEGVFGQEVFFSSSRMTGKTQTLTSRSDRALIGSFCSKKKCRFSQNQPWVHMVLQLEDKNQTIKKANREVFDQKSGAAILPLYWITLGKVSESSDERIAIFSAIDRATRNQVEICEADRPEYLIRLCFISSVLISWKSLKADIIIKWQNDERESIVTLPRPDPDDEPETISNVIIIYLFVIRLKKY
jgi:hypothetical protein